MTPNRMHLLRVSNENHSASLYELAKLTHRDLKNVTQDIAFLEDLGLVDLAKPADARCQRKPVLLANHFSVEVAI